MKSDVIEICLHSRRLGNTDYILRAAVRDHNVTIIAANEQQVKLLTRRYVQLYQEQPWYRKILDALFGHNGSSVPFPRIVSKAQFLKGSGAVMANDRPVIFDLYALYNEY